MESESLFVKCPKCGRSVLKSQKNCPDCKTRINKLEPKHWIIAAIFSFLVYSLVVSVDETEEKQTTTTPKKTDIKEEVREKLKLDYSWQKGEFASIMTADFTVTNNSLYDVKDIEIKCEHFSKSGTNIDSNSRSIYEDFPAGKSRSFPEFNMGFMLDQAYKTGCIVKNFKVIE